MANLTLRSLTNAGDITKGTPLTNSEMDQNLINLDLDIQTRAPLLSPVFTGQPKCITQTVGDNSTNIASTAFVTSASNKTASDAIAIAIAIA